MKRALFLDRNAKTASASPARARQLRELTGVLFACHKDLTLQSRDLTQGDTCTVPVTMTTWPTLSFTKTPASLSLCCVCVCVIPDHLFRWSCREVSGCKRDFRETVSEWGETRFLASQSLWFGTDVVLLKQTNNGTIFKMVEHFFNVHKDWAIIPPF